MRLQTYIRPVVRICSAGPDGICWGRPHLRRVL